jgi:hypothetical protein
MPVELKPCVKCGGQPKEHIFRVTEDSEGVIVACKCGHAGEQCEDAYVDAGMRVDAARSWNLAN